MEEVKNIVEKYGTQSDFWGVQDELRTVADRLHVPFEINESAVFP